MLKKHKRLKLTREQRKAIWAKPEANAGAGWESTVVDKPVDPINYLAEDKPWPVHRLPKA